MEDTGRNDEELEIIESILKWESKSKRSITKKELVQDIGLKLEEVDYFLDLLDDDSEIIYSPSEKADLQELGYLVLQHFRFPTLLELIESRDLFGIEDFNTIKKVAQYLLAEGFLEELPLVSPLDSDITEHKNGCPFCGEEILIRGKLCPFCGKSLPICCVCNLAICKGEPIYQCPLCDAVAHETHWREWIKIKNNCPVCKRKTT